MVKHLKKVFIFCTLISWTIPLLAKEEDKTVLLAVLARDKEHCLPLYLQCLDNLKYNKKLITVYINTNNNQDNTKEMLENWAQRNEKNYRLIIFESHEIEKFDKINPHQWSPKMFKILATIRNKSMQMAKDHKCDYYFVVDCDNFINPNTLKVLMSKDKPIIAPMLRSIPNVLDPYSNFFCAIDKRGYAGSHPDYMKILARKKIGTFKLPVVHCTYLIKSEYLDKLNYIDGTNDYEFVIFSRCARENNIDQYLCNEEIFGTLVHIGEGKESLQEEKRLLETFFQQSQAWNLVEQEASVVKKSF